MEIDTKIIDPYLMDPYMTDEDIIATFTPLEHQFYKWQILDSDETIRLGEDFVENNDIFYNCLQKKFPLPNIKHAFWDFIVKWDLRFNRRRRIVITAKDIHKRLRTTDCKDTKSLGETSLWMHTEALPDLLFGQSSFGGSLMHYALSTGPQYLFPDTPYGKMIEPSDPYILKDTVLAIDFDVNDCRPSALDSSECRGEDSIANEASATSVRGANSDDFLNKEPFVFFQIGALCCCTADEWMRRYTEYADEVYDPEFQHTGYGVVVRLDDNGYPTGAVYIVYKYQEEAMPAVSEDPNKPAFWKEREWRDSEGNELPHIRRLYPGCDQKFFLAKIADNLADLKEDGHFNIQVISEDRKTVVQAKRVGDTGMIIPNEIVAKVQPEDQAQSLLSALGKNCL
ncbi:hypothetical protein SEPCBS57363_006438 [Sporothrix epigloea]|uniref:Uncharacterized protein n=1 Tax=Sporothrix epigloea TaxID=1892477 RepID=A0ABP0E3H0_9PEZI